VDGSCESCLVESFYGREDLDLESRLSAELPGILNWSIAGLARLDKRGRFVVPKAARETAEQLEDLTSHVQRFAQERCELGADCWVDRDKLFSAWRIWSEGEGLHSGSKEEFGRKLTAAYPRVTPSRPRVAGDRPRGFSGIKLRPSPPKPSYAEIMAQQFTAAE